MICPKKNTLPRLSALFFIAVLAGCAETGPGKSTSSVSGSKATASGGGGYYKDDGPGSNIPRDIASIPDAVPRIEQYTKSTFRPYNVMGKRYVPISTNKEFRQEGTASWYGRKFHGRKTASGEKYDMYAMTAAHPTLPLPSYARVTRAGSNKSIIVRINDRGPFHGARIIDLSYVAAAKLDLIAPGSGKVVVEAISEDEIRRGKQAPDIAPEATMIAEAPAPKPTLTVRSAPASQGRIATRLASASPSPAIPDALQALVLAGAGQSALAAKSAPTRPDAMPAPVSHLARADALRPDSGAQAIETLATSSGEIFLQFGAFSAQQSARKLAVNLNSRMGDAELRPARVQPSGALYRVRIGPYASRTEAVNAANRIQQATGLNATVASR